MTVLVLRNQPKLEFLILSQHEMTAERIWSPNVLSDPLYLPLLLFPCVAVCTVLQAPVHLDLVGPFL